MREFEYKRIRMHTPTGWVHIGRKTCYPGRCVSAPEEGDVVIQIQPEELIDIFKSLDKRLRGLEPLYIRPITLLPQRKRVTP